MFHLNSKTFGLKAFVFVIILGNFVEGSEDIKRVLFESEWPVGDPKRCMDHENINKLNLDTFQVLPGIGWDNLINKETNPVVSYNFSQCKLSDDRRYILPNDVMIIPIKYSKVQTLVEIIEQWNNAKSLTADSINVGAGIESSFSISGKFSSEYEEMKSTQMKHNAMTSRAQLRYERYEVKLNLDPQLSPQFKNRLLEIGTAISMNQTELARYLSQLLVREFGTHVLTSITAGAGIVKDDYLNRSFSSLTIEQKSSIMVEASASFFSIFNFHASYSYKTESSTSHGYDKSKQQSYIHTLGGPKFKSNMSVDEWTDGVDNNLVAMDRFGNPLYFFITPNTVQEFPENIVESIAKTVKESIENYYEMNTIRGCTKLGEPNFSFSANFDDGTCKDVPTDIMFGGVYQTCTQEYYGESCSDLAEVNPKTGKYSCPDSYTPVEVKSSTNYFSSDYPAYFKTIKSYWCARDGKAEPNSGYLFGGIYTDTMANLLTGAMNCPPGFYSRYVFFNWRVCISDDFELYSRYSVPFGGFFTCNTGNPLAVGTIPSRSGGLKATSGNSLKLFLVKSGASAYAKRCPEGFSQHLVGIKQGCSIYYCVRTGSLNSPNTTSVNRPPFMTKPKTNSSLKVSVFKGKITENLLGKKNIYQSSAPSSKMSISTIIGVAIGTVVGCVGLIILIAVVVFKRRSRQSTLHRKLLGESNVYYGTETTA